MYYDTPISEVMTKNLTTIGPDDTLEVVDYIFNRNNFRHLPVVDKDGKIVGIISKSDYLMLCDEMTLLRKGLERVKNLRFLSSLLASEVMKKDLTTLPSNAKISEAAKVFKRNLFHAIPIVAEGDKLVGLITTIDLINYAYDQPALNAS